MFSESWNVEDHQLYQKSNKIHGCRLGNSPIDKRSIISHCLLIGGKIGAWKSKKEYLVTRTSAELEFLTMVNRLTEHVS